MENKLTDADIRQQDHVHNTAYNAVCELLGEDVVWDMEWIGKVSDCLVEIACEHFGLLEKGLYPYIEEE